MNALYVSPNPRVRRQSNLVFVVVALLVFGIFGVANMSHGPVKTTKVTVFSGESLWSLADKMHLDRDPRDWIADVVSMNHLGSSTLMPGMTLTVPVK
jgi:LysM domain